MTEAPSTNRRAQIVAARDAAAKMEKRRIYTASDDAMNRFGVRLPANLFFSRRRDFLDAEVRAHEALFSVRPDVHRSPQQTIDRESADKCNGNARTGLCKLKSPPGLLSAPLPF
jgi:hypothetical protein